MCRRYMARMLQIRLKTQKNQSINQSLGNTMNANKEMLAGNADADASSSDSDATYCNLNSDYADNDSDLCPGFVTVIFVSNTVL